MFGEFEGTYLIDNFSVAIEDATLGLQALKLEQSITLFPNPSNNSVPISTELTISSVKIVNSLGQLMHQFNNTQNIDLHAYAKGTYFLQIETKKGNIYFKKLLIK